MVDVITFEVWNTLLKPSSSYAYARVDMLKQIFAPSMDFVAAYDLLGKVDKEMDKKAETTGQHFGFKERVGEFWQQLPNDVIVETPSEDVINLAYQVHEKVLSQYLPSLIEVGISESLLTLRRRFHLGIVANTGFIDGYQLRRILDSLGIFSHLSPELLVFSDEVMMAKPSREIFIEAARRARVKTNKILHIGNNLETDYKAARNAGCQSWLLSSVKRQDMFTIPSVSVFSQMYH